MERLAYIRIRCRARRGQKKKIDLQQKKTLGSDAEIEAEVLWAAARPGTVAHDQQLAAMPELKRNFELLLLPDETTRLNGYKELVGSNCVYSLRNNPEELAMSNAGKATLHCVLKSNFPLYSAEHRRWLTPMETIAANTYVVSPSLSRFGETTSFARKREDFGLPARRRHCIYEQAGDGMSLPCIGLALLWLLIQDIEPTGARVIEASPLLSSLAMMMNKRRRA